MEAMPADISVPAQDDLETILHTGKEASISSYQVFLYRVIAEITSLSHELLPDLVY